MALFTVDFYSECLNRNVTAEVLLPVDRDNAAFPVDSEHPLKTLYLLHGIFGNRTDWITGSRIKKFSQKSRVAVIMPSGENSFYIDNERAGALYSRFIGEELVEMTRRMFPLSKKREDTFIAGLSMGGFGAVYNGLKYSETFSHIGGFSSALLTEKLASMAASPKSGRLTGNSEFYASIFGDLTKVKGSELDPKYLVEKLQREGRDIPEIYLCCGTEDGLLWNNDDFSAFLNEKGVSHTYETWPGEHNFDFWDVAVERFINIVK